MISSSVLFQEFKEQTDTLKQKQSYRQSNLRYFALFLACMIMLGDAYCFDNPMAMQTEIKKLYNIDNFKFNLLYTVYSLPNIILPFFGGVLIDKIGPRKAILLFSTIIMVGQLICVWGAYQVSYWQLIIGRVIFGMGSESLNVSQNSIMAQWFKNREISLAIGLCISIPKIGSALNSVISPIIVEQTGSVAEAMFAGAGVLVFSYICGLGLIYMDSESDKREQQNVMLLINNIFDDSSNSQQQIKKHMVEDAEDEHWKQEDVDAADGFDSPDLLEAESEFDESPQIFATPDERKSKKIQQNKMDMQEHGVGHEEVKEEINLKDIAKMSGTFWILIIICMMTEALFVPFLDNGNELFQERFFFSSQQAGLFLIIPYLIAAITTPIVGTIADKVGMRSILIIITSFIFLITHILFVFVACNGVCGVILAPLVSLGLCFAFYASVVIPSVPMVVKANLVGTAFGLMGVFQNTALALFPLITGMLFNQFSNLPDGEHDPERGYKYQSYFFVGMSTLLVFIAVLLSIVDKAGDRKLSVKGSNKKSSVLHPPIKQTQLAQSSHSLA